MGNNSWGNVSCLSILTLMVFWGQIQNYMMRSNLNFLIVTMVNESSVMSQQTPSNTTDISERCHIDLDNVGSLNKTSPIGMVEDLATTSGSFHWDAWQRAFILGANSYGYLCTQIIGGRLTEIYGVKRIYGFGLLGSGILTALSPWAAYQHPNFLVALRIGIGLLTGVTFPSLHAMTARWVPVERRSRFISRSYFGTTFGLIITFPMCAYIVSWWNWEGAFYAISFITGIWFVFWWMLVFDSPQDHPRISSNELEYLNASIGREIDHKDYPQVPWRSIITSVPFWGILLTDMGNTFGIVVLASNGPTYLSFMLNLDLKLNAIVSGLPMMCRYFGGVLHSFASDSLISRQILSVTNTRRIFNSISQITPAICMACLYFAQCDWLGVLVLLCIGMFFNGAISSGHFSSHVDLAPNFAGTLLGISNTFSGGLMGFVTPLAVAALTEDMTMSSWTTLFSVTAVIYVVGNLLYVVLISGETQSWNHPIKSRRPSEDDTVSAPLKL